MLVYSDQHRPPIPRVRARTTGLWVIRTTTQEASTPTISKQTVIPVETGIHPRCRTSAFWGVWIPSQAGNDCGGSLGRTTKACIERSRVVPLSEWSRSGRHCHCGNEPSFSCKRGICLAILSEFVSETPLESNGASGADALFNQKRSDKDSKMAPSGRCMAVWPRAPDSDFTNILLPEIIPRVILNVCPLHLSTQQHFQ